MLWKEEEWMSMKRTATNKNRNKQKQPQTKTATNKNRNKQKQQQTKTATNKNSQQKQPTETVNRNSQQHSYLFHHFATGGGGKRNKTVHSSVRGQNDFIRDVVLFLLRLRGKGFGGTEKINRIDQRRSQINRSEEGVESIKAIRSK